MGSRVSTPAPMPLVSIILCTFNRAALITRALRSVVYQSYKKWELIIIDDGSQDGTEDLLLPLAKIDERLIYHRHANRGLAASRNVGLSLASGSYVTFLDSDDEYLPKHIDKRVEYMVRHPHVDMIHGGLRCKGSRSKHFVPDARNPIRKIHVSNCFVAGTMMAKREVLRKIGGFRDLVFADDFDLFQRMGKRFNVKKVSLPTYIYNCDGEDRLCELYEKGGVKEILQFRGGASV